ncbi:MAG: hypothetical protein HRT69_12780 [Flavobacteriaceae bacterium]|nr:hypothetical protein [Flavobacteriaceae bacterium]
MNAYQSNWNVKRKENKALIELYQAFFFSEKLSFNSRSKLIEEITKLESENDWINGMTQSERRQDDLSSELIHQSIINLTTNNKLQTA